MILLNSANGFGVFFFFSFSEILLTLTCSLMGTYGCSSHLGFQEFRIWPSRRGYPASYWCIQSCYKIPQHGFLSGWQIIKISLFRSLFRFWLSQMIAVVDTNGVLQQQFVGKDEL